MFRDFGKYKEAIAHNDLYRMYMDSVENINRSMKVAEIQAKYDRQKLLNENNQLLIQKSHFIKSAFVHSDLIAYTNWFIDICLPT